MIKKLEMTVLADNLAAEPLEGEWGLSILIDADDRRILLDTGSSGLFAENAGRLDNYPDSVDTGVLSHAHYDHADGLDTFFLVNRNAPFLIREGASENCFGVSREGILRYNGIRRGLLEEHAPRIRYVRGVHKIADGIWLVPHRTGYYAAAAMHSSLYAFRNGELTPDDFSHEQSLVIETERGPVVLNSCSHTGMANILADVRLMLGFDEILAYVGGLHLYKMTDAELDALCGEIRNAPVGRILTGHCTGDHAFRFLQERLGSRVGQFFSGFRYTF